MIRGEYADFADRQLVRQAKKWTPVSAQVVDFSRAAKWIRDGKVSSHQEYEVLVRYQYKVAGISHLSQQDKFLDYEHQQREFSIAVWNCSHTVSYRKSVEERIESDYAISSEHVAKYDPANPANSCLDPNDGPVTAEALARRIGMMALLTFAAIYVYIRVMMSQGDKSMEKTRAEYPEYFKD